MVEEYDYLFKSIVVGDGGVGKTALTLRFSKGFFTEDYKMTIGVDFHVKTIAIDALEGPIRAKLQIWDTGGQERFSSIRPMYYRGSLGALLIFDLTNAASFEHLPQWIEEVRANVKSEIPLLLVGNKSDLIDQRVVSLEEINSFTSTFNLYYMETSAKTGEGVGDCFHILACLMIGSGVPDQLISRGTVFTPGNIPLTGSQSLESVTPQIEPEFDFAAPPVPEPGTTELRESSPTFEPEPQFDFAAPPVPEPVSTELNESSSAYEPEYEPEIPIPEPRIEESLGQSAEFIFKTPEEILDSNTSEANTIPNIEPILEDSYKPRAIPFTSNIPIPAPAPKDFQPPQEVKPIETSQPKTTPFLVQQDSISSQANVSIEEPIQIHSKKDKKKKEKQKKKDERERKLQEEKEKQEKLIEDMKKEKQKKKDEKEKKLQEEKEKQKQLIEDIKKEKQKKKDEKEKKLQKEKEKQEQLIEDMKKIKKEKKEKPKKEKKEKVEQILPKTIPPQLASEKDSSTSPSLFQTLSQKTDEDEKKVIASFVPFSEKEESKSQESSKLRIIPNIGDTETSPNAFTPILSTSPIPDNLSNSNQANIETIGCKKCGSVLSNDYLYCNKCGTKL